MFTFEETACGAEHWFPSFIRRLIEESVFFVRCDSLRFQCISFSSTVVKCICVIILFSSLHHLFVCYTVFFCQFSNSISSYLVVLRWYSVFLSFHHFCIPHNRVDFIVFYSLHLVLSFFLLGYLLVFSIALSFIVLDPDSSLLFVFIVVYFIILGSDSVLFTFFFS